MYHLWPFLLVHAFCVLRNICLIQDEKKNLLYICLLIYLLFSFFFFGCAGSFLQHGGSLLWCARFLRLRHRHGASRAVEHGL